MDLDSVHFLNDKFTSSCFFPIIEKIRLKTYFKSKPLCQSLLYKITAVNSEEQTINSFGDNERAVFERARN